MTGEAGACGAIGVWSRLRWPASWKDAPAQTTRRKLLGLSATAHLVAGVAMTLLSVNPKRTSHLSPSHSARTATPDVHFALTPTGFVLSGSL